MTIGWALPIAVILLAGVMVTLVLGRRFRPAGLAIILISLILCAVAVTRLWTDLRDISPTEPDIIVFDHDATKILYWKLMRTSQDFAGAERIIAATDADFMMIEEMGGPLGAVIDATMRRKYPYRSTCRSECDQAIFSRRPIIAERRFSRGRPLIIWVRTTDAGGRQLTLVLAHIEMTARRNRALQIAVELATADRDDMVLAGDLNLPPWSATMHMFDDFVAPLKRQTHGLPTWPAQILGKPMPFAFQPTDQIFTGPYWTNVNIQRIPAAPSDHFPLLVTVRH